ncbi:Ig-like domain-containing protein [Mangrovimonas xylaniphaga]|uniref:Ig-like domain-containing protein n=1 Tax=Mangrovimonas xylaniphaga TaxID=1645915 RepID=UPI0006B66F5B|nr:T9SS type B sorting domain-containing protein [Mangrovimonas xylaniphaga]
MIPKIHIFLFLVFLPIFCAAQGNVPPSIEAEGDQDYCPLSQISIVTSFDIVDPDDTSVEALYIQISTGYQQGVDNLVLTGSHPNISTSWDANQGKLTLTGVGTTEPTYTDLIAAVNDVMYQSNTDNVSGEKYFSFTVGDANFLPSTGHYYEYVPNLGITWIAAKAAAESSTYYGLQGYLATITSAEEAQLSGEQAAGAGWIGGSDVESEGTWKWMTGPEEGMVFWNGGVNGSTPNYAFWNTGEPNNLNNEDYAHVTAPGVGVPGSWNDLPNAGDTSGDYQPKGYIIEYGGMPGDPEVDISASTKITIPEIVNVVGATVCGSGSVELEAVSSGGTVLWFDDPNGTSIASGLTFTTPEISVTTTYYVLASINGCPNGIKEPVVATVVEIPTITDYSEAIICGGSGSGVLSATPSQGTVFWYDAMVGGNVVGTGNYFTTPELSDTATFYAEAQYNDCISENRVPVTLTVQDTPSPIADAEQVFCTLENTTIADLQVEGTAVVWYGTETGGTPLATSQNLENGTSYYASQTIDGCESSIRTMVTVVLFETPQVPNDIAVLEVCDSNLDGDDTNGISSFDLTQNESVILDGAPASEYSFSYFLDVAFSQEILTPDNFENTVANTQSIYVRITNFQEDGCYSEGSFDIQVNALPDVVSSLVFKNCDEDGLVDGYTNFNLNEINEVLVDGSSEAFEISYHLTLDDANDGIEAVDPVPFNNSVSEEVFARVVSVNGCFRVSTITLEVSTTSFQDGYMETLEYCDDDGDGFYEFDLSQMSQVFLDQFPTGQNLSVHYYQNLADAQLEQNEIDASVPYTNETPDAQLLYVRVESDDNGDCFGIGPHLMLEVYTLPQFDTDDEVIYCLEGDPVTLMVTNPNGSYTYEWTDSSGTVISNTPSVPVASGGLYSVVATSEYGCQSEPSVVTVIESSVAELDEEDITIQDFSNNNTVSINPNGLGIGDYEYALDDEFSSFQDDPYFDEIAAGEHILYVRDKNGCGIAQLEIFVVGYVKFFSPNGDTYNDVWNIKGFNEAYSEKSTVNIFDRYGKLMAVIKPSGSGWDGTFNGVALPATDYWFEAQLIRLNGQTRTLRGHFSLLR